MEEEYDFVIIGAGGVGLSAGMYAARLGLKTLILGHSYEGWGLPIGGTITLTNDIQNYPGFVKISGIELVNKLKEHAEAYDLVTIKAEEVLNVKKQKNGFGVKTKKSEYFGKTVLFATGTKNKKFEAKGAKEFQNKGVNYCALCDAPLYKDKIVGVVGGGDAATIESLILAAHAKKVYIFVRKEKLRAEEVMKKKIEENKKIEIVNNTNVVEVKGNQKMEKIVLDKEYRGKKELELDGLFIAIGHIFLSDLAKKIGVKTNKKEEIIIDHMNCKTNIPGVFAAGDVTDKNFKQLITGVADGCTAAHSAFEFLKH